MTAISKITRQILAALYIILNHTPFGRHSCAIGGNRAAAIASGINVDRVAIAVFGLVGVTAAISGVMLSSQLMIVDGTLGTGLEHQAIAISVLGGTSLSGGNGNLVGTLLAVLFLATIASAHNILKVAAFYQYLFVGVLLIFAPSIDTLRADHSCKVDPEPRLETALGRLESLKSKTCCR
jgi:ribose/xylose/arabinose/galactoside ABC-type transport system permease subunit